MYKTIDLFAGIGGIRIAFEKTNKFKNLLSAELDKYACKTYKHLFGNDPYADVRDAIFHEKVARLDYDVLLGGFPCQAFSIAGAKKGFEEARGTLFFELAKILEKTKPKAFLFENVEGLISHNKGNTFKTILNILNKLDYHVIGTSFDLYGNLVFQKTSFLRNAKDFGLPQKRSRLYIVGFKRSIIPKNYRFDPLPSGRGKLYKDLNELLEFKADPSFYLASGAWQSLKKHKENHKNKKNGFGYEIVNHPSIKMPISNTILATGGSGKERNLVFDPQENIKGLELAGKKTPLNDECVRVMTPREWGKLQGFINYAFLDESGKDSFTFPPDVSNTQLYKQFGNSVAIPVVEEIAKYINENFKKMGV